VSVAPSQEAAAYLSKRFEGLIASVTEVQKEDLGMLNHLSGTKGKFLQLRFRTVSALMDVRKVVLPIVERNALRRDEASGADVLECFCDIREYDVPYYVRVSIDLEVRVGCWYSVVPEADNCKLTLLKDMVEKVCGFALAYPRDCISPFVCS
jgi:DNA polymerase epsilon subunit 1